LSKSQVSVMAKEVDTAVEAFRTRPLDAGPYTFVAADALVLKVREQGRVVNVHALIAVGVNAEGYREILGIDVTTAEDGAGWLTFWRSLTARGLSGVKLITSDAHAGLVAAIGATLPGAAWQRSIPGRSWLLGHIQIAEGRAAASQRHQRPVSTRSLNSAQPWGHDYFASTSARRRLVTSLLRRRDGLSGRLQQTPARTGGHGRRRQTRPS